MRKIKLNDLGAVLGIILVFVFIVYIFFSPDYMARKEEAVKDLIIFLAVFILVFGFALIARREINIDNKKREPEVEKELKNESVGFAENDMRFFGKVFKILFHFLPLYFTLFIIKIDLLMEYKVILIVLSLLAYALVELNYLFGKVLDFVSYIRKVFKIESWWGTGLLLLAFFGGVFGVTIYFAYNLIMFYFRRY